MKHKRIYPQLLKMIENNESDNFHKEKDLRVMISFEDTTKRDKFLSNHPDLKILKKFDIIPSINLHLTFDQIKSLENEELIKIIEEDQKLHLSILEVNEILDLSDYRTSQISYSGKNIKIGIIDNGINKIYDSISDIDVKKFNYESNTRNLIAKKTEISHGTIMACIIGNQYRDKDYNYIGIAPNAKFIDFNIPVSNNEYYFSHILEIFDSINLKFIEIDILFIPFTTSNPSDGNDLLSQACNLLVDKGIIIVCPVGNFGPKAYTVGSPSAAQKVITIGSLTKNLTVSNFSSRGPTLDERLKPDFCLPGSKIKIPLSNELNVRVSGTSVSAAFCVGIIALIKEFNPNASYSDVFDIMKQVCIDLNYQKYSQGHGLINIVNIFKKLDLYQEKIIPYNYLLKRSFKITIEFMLILILFYYLVYFFTSL